MRPPGTRARDRGSKLLVVILAVAALASPAPAWAALSASVADLALGAVPYSHADRTTSGSLALTAQDTGRQECVLLVCSTVNDGWNVTLRASDFAYSGTNNGTAIPAANLVITTAHPPTRVSGQAISSTGGPRTTGVTGTLDVTRKTLQADGPSGGLTPTYYGIGTYRQVIDVGLTVPGRSRAGTYTTTLTVTMSAGP
jgi:hypothetical protein